jgi:hypothetical protein
MRDRQRAEDIGTDRLEVVQSPGDGSEEAPRVVVGFFDRDPRKRALVALGPFR